MPEREDHKKLRSYLLAVEDTAFLQRDELRPLRLALEFNKVDLVLTDLGIKSTVVVFGSSRILSPDQAEAKLCAAQGEEALKTAERQRRLSAWYQEARNFGRIVSERGSSLESGAGAHENVIVTGGGPGIMEAANRGAADAGAPSVGFNIVLPTEQPPNAYSTPELTFRFLYYAVRKMHFAMRANALAVFPGGLGTLDELFEILTLKQTRKTPLMPVILFSRSYWRETINFDRLAEFGMIDGEDTALFDVVDTAEEAWQLMVKRGLKVQTPLREA
jgi:uncharacterized protein (TIGR00730 family)